MSPHILSGGDTSDEEEEEGNKESGEHQGSAHIHGDQKGHQHHSHESQPQGLLRLQPTEMEIHESIAEHRGVPPKHPFKD